MKISRGPVAIAGIYFIFGFLWILISDKALEAVASGPEMYRQLQTSKGWIYVAVTTVLIYLLLSTYAAIKQKALDELNAGQSRLKEALREKEELIRELHHRVKNNLQLLLSIISLSETPEALTGRIHAISSIQEAIYAGGAYSKVSLGRYLPDLLAYLKAASREHWGDRISLEIEEGLFLPAEKAVPFGILFHELTGNAITHARGNGGEQGRIFITLKTVDGGMALEVEDSGTGFDTARVTRGVGLAIAEAMCGQIDGRFELRSSASGTRAAVTLPQAASTEKDTRSDHR